MKRALITVAVLFLIPAAALAARDLPEDLKDVGIDQRLNEPVPLDLTFRDEGGKAVRLGDYFGDRPVILVLAYYRCPRLCTQVLNGLVQGLRDIKDLDMGDEFQVVTVSFDPEETPKLAAAKKQAYVAQYGRPGAAQGWHFLTGEEASIKKLAKAVGFRYAWDAKHQQYVHASGIMVVTPRGMLCRYFYGINFKAQDLRFGLMDAADGIIGSPVEQVKLLFCYAYDPATGQYRMTALNAVRVVGAATVLILGFFLIRAWRRVRPEDRNLVKTAG